MNAAHEFLGQLEGILPDGTVLQEIAVALLLSLLTNSNTPLLIPLHRSRGYYISHIVSMPPTIKPAIHTPLLVHKGKQDPVQ